MKKKCLHPFTSLNINPVGNISPCCAYPVGFDNITNIENLIEFFNNDTNFVEIRDIENNGKWKEPECNMCKAGEVAGIITRKTFIEQSFSKHKPVIEPNGDIRFLDIAFSNTCNLTCVMCDSKFSSAWHKPISGFNKSWITPIKPVGLEYNDVDKILDILDTVDIIEIKGGEPLYDKRFIYFLEKIYNRNISAEIHLITNFTVINDKYCEYLNSIKNLHLSISIDGIDKTYEWMRGCKFQVIEDNLLTFLPKLNANNISINFTSTVYNIGNIKKFCDWIDNISIKTNKRLSMNLNLIAKHPMYVSPLLSAAIPQAIEDLHYIKSKKYNVIFNNNGKTIDNLIEFLSQKIEITNEVLTQHTEWHNLMVSMGGFDINEYNK